MKNLIKFLLIFIIAIYHLSIRANEIQKVIFTIDDISYTSIDLDNRKKYIDLIRDRGLEKKNNLFYLNDLISVLLFNLEYNKINYQNNHIQLYIHHLYRQLNHILT